ncbi:hypothetical protein [Paremcibacter congregatus]|uniref:hypothetical protein n=1 Tax=Paremcibacter congregatus TaxID=2043170 RepID=UPI001123088C|nr:hypothetical protein [Paremcibacter congregatus]QDE27284.1 hypothetical protein FIV45_08290 [Paremcibacter congregatus]
MAAIEIKNIGALDDRAKSDFKDFSHNGVPGFYRREVRAGRLSVFSVLIDGLRVGSLALRREVQPHGSEMVIVAGGGSYRGQRLVPLMLEFLEGLAGRNGEQSVRFHTKREPLALVAQGRGYIEIDDGDPDEITMRKVL